MGKRSKKNKQVLTYSIIALIIIILLIIIFRKRDDRTVVSPTASDTTAPTVSGFASAPQQPATLLNGMPSQTSSSFPPIDPTAKVKSGTPGLASSAQYLDDMVKGQFNNIIDNHQMYMNDFESRFSHTRSSNMELEPVEQVLQLGFSRHKNLYDNPGVTAREVPTLDKESLLEHTLFMKMYPAIAPESRLLNQ